MSALRARLLHLLCRTGRALTPCKRLLNWYHRACQSAASSSANETGAAVVLSHPVTPSDTSENRESENEAQVFDFADDSTLTQGSVDTPQVSALEWVACAGIENWPPSTKPLLSEPVESTQALDSSEESALTVDSEGGSGRSTFLQQPEDPRRSFVRSLRMFGGPGPQKKD